MVLRKENEDGSEKNSEEIGEEEEAAGQETVLD